MNFAFWLLSAIWLCGSVRNRESNMPNMPNTPTATEAATLEQLRWALEIHFDSKVSLKLDRDTEGNLISVTYTDKDGDLDLIIEHKSSGWHTYNRVECDDDDPLAGYGIGTTMTDAADGILMEIESGPAFQNVMDRFGSDEIYRNAVNQFGGGDGDA
jgi:hypothetical protein